MKRCAPNAAGEPPSRLPLPLPAVAIVALVSPPPGRRRLATVEGAVQYAETLRLRQHATNAAAILATAVAASTLAAASLSEAALVFADLCCSRLIDHFEQQLTRSEASVAEAFASLTARLHGCITPSSTASASAGALVNDACTVLEAKRRPTEAEVRQLCDMRVQLSLQQADSLGSELCVSRYAHEAALLRGDPAVLAGLSVAELREAEATVAAALARLAEARLRALLAEEQREASECVVCKERAKRICFGPCGHLICCEVCAAGLDTCPVCRGPVTSKLRAFS